MLRGPTLVLSALATLYPSCQEAAPTPPSAPTPLLASPAPEFRRQALDGAEVSLAGLRGRTVVIEFFAQYCQPCAKSLPALEELRSTAPDVAVIGISEDGDPNDALRMVRDLELRFPVVHDRGNVLAGRFRVVDLPATFVMDAHGAVRWHGNKVHSASEMRAVIESLKVPDP